MKKLLLFLVLLLISFMGCDTGNTPSNGFGLDPFIGWTSEHHHSDFSSSSAKIYIWVNLNDNTSYDDIRQIDIESENGSTWSLLNVQIIDNYYPEENYFWFSLVDRYSQPENTSIHAGTYTIRAYFTDGTNDSGSVVNGFPGSSTSEGIETLYAYNNTDTKDNSFAPLLALTEVSSASISAIDETLTLNFSVNDGRVSNGYVWLYDSSGDGIGGTDWFTEVAGTINVDGTTNSIVFDNSEIEFSEGHSLSDISSLHVLLVDGVQYEPLTDDLVRYDHRSISAEYIIP